MYIILHLRLRSCVTHCVCPQVLLIPEDDCDYWEKRVGALKLCVVRLVWELNWVCETITLERYNIKIGF